MRITQKQMVMEQVEDALAILTTKVKLSNARGRTDINSDAEDFYCGLLNIVLNKNLQNQNLLEMDFPAIDLADGPGRLCVQVTSTEDREKITSTLSKFFDRKLDKDFDRLMVLIIGRKGNYQREFATERSFDFQKDRDIWDTARLLREIERLEPDRLESVDAYLLKHLSFYQQERNPLLDLVMGSAMPDDRFVGRGEELRRIEEELTKNRVAFLSGLGGMGKTELALRYGDGYRNAGRGQVYFVRFKKTFDQTVTDNIAPFIPGFNRDGLNEQQIIEGALKHLRKGDPGDLLILDNVDEIGSYDALTRDSVFQKLRKLPMKLLVTTRLHARGGIALEPLSNPELYRFFEQHDLDLETGTMDKLIAAVNAHTMTVDLMARTMDESWETVTAEMILEAMANSSLPEADYPEVYTDHNQDPEQRQIYAHLRSLFNLTNIPEDGKQALRCATLLPQAGMDPALFLRGLPKGPADAIRLLEKQGWVQRENHLLTIHPVVRMVCKRELEPDEEHCWPFVKGVCDWYDPNNYDHVRFHQLAELLANAAETLGDPNGWYIGTAGYLWNELGESQQALQCNLRDVELREQCQPDSKNLAAAYNKVGNTYNALGNHAKALVYHQKALAIWEKVLPPEHPNLAGSYNNVGCTYDGLGDSATALEYKLKALAIWEKALPPEHPDLAGAYNNVGVTYGNLGDHAKALEYQLKALTLKEKVLTPEHPDLAGTYHNLGVIYGALGDPARALEYEQKALAIREKVLPPEHPYLAASYNNVGQTYGDLGDHARALEYKQKALVIFEKVLLSEHPYLATSYDNVGSTYYAQEDYVKALEYLLKALTIRKKVLPPTHPDLAMSYSNVAWTYYELVDYETALKFMRRAADIADQSLPEGHPDRVDYRR